MALNSNSDMAFIADIVIDELGSGSAGILVSPAQLSAGRRLGTFTRGTTSPWFVLDWLLVAVNAAAIRGSDSVCVVNFHPSNIFYLLLARLLGRKRVLFLHDVRTHYRGAKGFVNLILNRAMIALATRLVVFSEQSRGDARRLFSREAIVLPLPSPAEGFIGTPLAVPDGYGLEPGKFGIFWGRAYAYKGVGFLPSIAGVLQRTGLKLVVSCSPGDRDSRKMLDDARRHPNVVAIDGPLQESVLAALVSNASVNFCPYLQATQSGVLMYCMALGVPSVVSKGTALEQNIDEDTGESADFNAEDEVGRAIERARMLPRPEITRKYLGQFSSRALSAEVRKMMLQQ